MTKFVMLGEATVIITLKLMKNGECVIYLTEKTIKKINFISSKVKDNALMGLTKDFEMIIQVENSALIELYGQKLDEINKPEFPREIDSVRLLINYAITSNDGEYTYLDCEIEKTDAFTNTVSKYSFKQLFVMRFEEWFSINDRETYIRILLRERV